MATLAAVKSEAGPAKTGRFFPSVPADFREKFDNKPFVVSHNLTASHPLFAMSRMRKLANFLRNNNFHVHYDVGNVGVGQRWDAVPKGVMTFEAAIERIENAGAWIFLKQVEQDPEYGELLESMMAEVSELSGRDIKREMKLMEAIIFITSPNRITSYHIDRECNFLLQVSGDKEISVFDREDRDVLPEKEIETFWSKDSNAAKYREQYQNRANVFQMTPGNGVHIPVNCPHWLQNGNNVSISFSVSYQFKDSRRKFVYQSNYYLRRMGLNPTPPGRSSVRDAAKRIAMGTALNTRNFIFRRKKEYW
jgi:hypothetical protein